MSSEFFGGRKWIATVSLAAAMAATGIYGATTGKLPFEHVTPTVKVATRSEASAGRGYSAVVKRVVPAVVNISISKVVKQQTGFEGGDDQGRGQVRSRRDWNRSSASSSAIRATAAGRSSRCRASAPRRLSDRA